MVLLGGSWVVISGVISPLIRVIIRVTLLITPLITGHEPPSRGSAKLLSIVAIPDFRTDKLKQEAGLICGPK